MLPSLCSLATLDSLATPISVATGILGILGTLFSGKVFVPTFIFNREREAADFGRAEIARLNLVIQQNTERAIPVLEASTAAQVKGAEALAAANLVIHDLTLKLEKP